MATGCSITVASHADLGMATHKVEAAMTAPTLEQAEGWLVMLQAACARRSESEAFNAAALSLYSGALTRFPADVAKAACATLARGTGGVTWFPTLGELIDACERLAGPRVALQIALAERRMKEAPREHKPSTAEERALVAKMRDAFVAEHKSKQAERPTIRPNYAEVDETGVSQELRDIIARQRA